MLESYFLQIDRQQYYGFSYKLLKIITDELGIFRPFDKLSQGTEVKSVEFMEKYEIGGKKEEIEEDEEESEEEKLEKNIDSELRRNEIKFFRGKSGFGRQVILI